MASEESISKVKGEIRKKGSSSVAEKRKKFGMVQVCSNNNITAQYICEHTDLGLMINLMVKISGNSGQMLPKSKEYFSYGFFIAI